MNPNTGPQDSGDTQEHCDSNSSTASKQIRYERSQQNRTLLHPMLPQPPQLDEQGGTPVGQVINDESKQHSSSHRFLVCADTQIGMLSGNKEWETELQYSRDAIQYINAMEPRPSFCCMCGDLVDMEYTFFEGKGFTREECDTIQDRQNDDIKEVWSALHDDIALVCLCGNHDIGNRPTRASITKFTNAFGDDYSAFWVNGTYNITLNSTLISNHSLAEDMYDEQLNWLKGRLAYAQQQNARQIFVFSHHPWFLYHDEEEEATDLEGSCPYPTEWGGEGKPFPDSYFVIPKKYRMVYMDLFRQYKVRAAFTGHYHQNWVTKTSFGMDMIITGPLSMVFDSTSKPDNFTEEKARGVRIVDVGDGDTFEHRFVSVEE